MWSILRKSLVVACLCVCTTPLAAAGRVYAQGNGVKLPTIAKEVRPTYPPAAKKMGITGSVTMDCVVRPDGSVGKVKVLKSLDAKHGFDQAAMDAMKQWRFNPGLKGGKPVAVHVTTEMTFTIR